MPFLRRALIVAALLASSFTVATGSVAAAAQSSCDQWIGPIADVSNWNASIPSGLKGLYIEQGDGGWISPTFANQQVEARSAGVPWGAYQFLEPSSDLSAAVTNATKFVFTNGAGGTLPPVEDVEVSNGLSDDQVVAYATTWANTVTQLTGRVVMVYTGPGYGWAWNPALSAYGARPLWLAAYPGAPSACANPLPTVPGAWSSWSVWQWTSSGGTLDLNVAEPAWWALVTGSDGTSWGPGSVGPKVKLIQQAVGVPVTGTYDNATTLGVAKLQVLLGVPSDGTWGPSTDAAYSALMRLLAAHVIRPHAPIRYGAHSVNVRHLQRALNIAGVRVQSKRIHLTSHYDDATAASVHNLKASCKHLHNRNGKVFGARAGHCLDRRLARKGH